MKKMIITGHLGRDPESRHTPNGDYFVTFSVAINVGTKANPKTDWVDITCNGKMAETAQVYLKKGKHVLVEGFPTVNAYINKEGKAAATIRISAKFLEILSTKDSGSDHLPHDEPAEHNSGAEDDFSHISSDDIPF